MLTLIGGRAGLALSRPVLWAAGGVIVLLSLGAAALPATPTGEAHGAVPVAGAAITQGFGCTDVVFEPPDPACPSGHFHSGVDLAVATGTPVYAVAGGTAQVIVSVGGYGIHVVVDCGQGVEMLYGHLAAAALTGPTLVAAGTLLGWVGSTGLSTGPHLHFEVRRGGEAVDPMPWLPAYAGGLNQRREPRW
ncbi:MAG TPA: M23 family metallopeptidase [Candidatus Dormibacteraeota bacterium]